MSHTPTTEAGAPRVPDAEAVTMSDSDTDDDMPAREPATLPGSLRDYKDPESDTDDELPELETSPLTSSDELHAPRFKLGADSEEEEEAESAFSEWRLDWVELMAQSAALQKRRPGYACSAMRGRERKTTSAPPGSPSVEGFE